MFRDGVEPIPAPTLGPFHRVPILICPFPHGPIFYPCAIARPAIHPVVHAA
jgi:hypothetical protein